MTIKPHFEHGTLLEYPLDEIAAVLTDGFDGYFVPINITKQTLLVMIQQYGVDLSASYMIRKDGSPVGAVLIGRRGSCSRVAAMSIQPQFRGTGAGSYILDKLLVDARQRGDQSLVLEVIEQNEPAHHLYEKFGFTKVRRLVGYTKAADSARKTNATQKSELHEIEMTTLARNVLNHGPADLPWQLAGDTLCNFSLPQRAYQLGSAYLALSDLSQPNVAIHSLLVLPDARGQGQAKRILETAVAHFPNRSWKMPAICPEEFGGVFAKLGFVQEEITQFQMRLDL